MSSDSKTIPDIRVHSVFDAEGSFFAGSKTPSLVPEVRLMRYDVLVIRASDSEPMIGKIITSLPLDKYCQEHGFSNWIMQSHGPARPGEVTDLT